MKKTITQLLFAAMVALSVHVSAQSSKAVSGPVVKMSSNQPVVVAVQNGVSASYQTGFSSEGMVMCLIFKNTNSSESSFTWTLKDKMGKVVYTSNTVKIESGQTIDMNNTGNNNSKFVIALNSGTTGGDYSIQITSIK